MLEIYMTNNEEIKIRKTQSHVITNPIPCTTNKSKNRS